MKFADCEVTKNPTEKPTKYFRTFEMFDPYVQDLESSPNRTKTFKIGSCKLILKGIPEDYKIYFSSENSEGSQSELKLVGERLFNIDFHININLYKVMADCFRNNEITF